MNSDFARQRLRCAALLVSKGNHPRHRTACHRHRQTRAHHIATIATTSFVMERFRSALSTVMMAPARTGWMRRGKHCASRSQRASKLSNYCKKHGQRSRCLRPSWRTRMAKDDALRLVEAERRRIADELADERAARQH